jgi:hypothetical protein
MKALLVLPLALLLTACPSLQYAGNASYSVKPFTDSNGQVVCCAVDVRNGKEIANLEAHVTKQGDNYTVDLKEQGVAAFAGQKIAAEAFTSAVTEATKAAVAAVLAPLLPALAPALVAPGLGAAALGAGVGIGVDKLVTPKAP